MCIIVFGYKVHPEYRLILSANRDEFCDRPTEQACWWSPTTDNEGNNNKEHNIQILAGRDGLSGGTWIGVSREGRFAAVTNYRNGSNPNIPDARSRGLLVTSWLLTGREHHTTTAASSYMKNVAAEGHAYNGFNLIVGDTESIWYYSNRSESNSPIQIVKPGIYGLSNELLDTPWPKVVRSKSKLKEVIDRGTITHEKLFKIMSDPWRPPDEDLPDTHVGLAKERFLSATFLSPMKDPSKEAARSAYGTCCSTLLTIDSSGEAVEFVERSFTEKENGDSVISDAKFSFRVNTREVDTAFSLR